MNRRSLVLAADSAATVSRWERGRKEERYFKGSNKIFQLSNVEPVGIMIYDSADLHRVPWEIIVKTYRKNLGTDSFPSIEEYGRAFFSFVEQNRGLFPTDYLDEVLVENADQIMIRFLNMIKEDDRVKAAGSDVAAATLARNTALQEHLDATVARPLKAPFDDDAVDAIRAQHGLKIQAEADADVEIFLEGAPVDSAIVAELGLQALFRRPDYIQSETGIVIAGYGKDDFFPSFVEFSCLGFLGQHLSFEKTGEHAIDRRDSGFFKTFATTAMADTFTMGFGPDVFRSVRLHLQAALYDFADKIANDVGHPCANVDQFVDETLTSHTKTWTEEVYEKHGRPLRRVIGSLPIEELASLAETLVMLESLKEKVTSPSESVGGPIDVAIITKHEGFVWAKRKLYFDPKLNSRFFLRQRSEHDGGIGIDDGAA
jgi:hypothetical protein